MIKTNFVATKQRIEKDLAEQGWTIQDNVLEPELIAQLAAECRHQYAQGLLRDAGVGRAEQRSVQKSVRGDKIRWLDQGMSAATDQFLNTMNDLQSFLNKSLYLGLASSEHHFALYSDGAFYRQHVDRFKDNDSRTVSSILYLNSDWKPEHGGELRLHLNDRQLDVAPIANRLVLFMSGDILHEVLPTNAERLSLTGWFKRAVTL